MKAFDYAKPTAAADAIRQGQAATARFIAGGTVLVDLLRLDVEQPGHVHAAGLRDAAQVIAQQVDDHHVLGPLLRREAMMLQQPKPFFHRRSISCIRPTCCAA